MAAPDVPLFPVITVLVIVRFWFSVDDVRLIAAPVLEVRAPVRVRPLIEKLVVLSLNRRKLALFAEIVSWLAPGPVMARSWPAAMVGRTAPRVIVPVRPALKVIVFDPALAARFAWVM